MAEPTSMDRLQPCLLDRLTDDQPAAKGEGRYARVMSMRKYRLAVLRDLEMLLNSKSRPFGDLIYGFSDAAASVLNYGIPDICGRTISQMGPAGFAEYVKHAIACFEPRILPRSLSVRMVTRTGSGAVRTISFEIEGELWAQPAPDHLLVKTEVDLDSGRYSFEGEAIG